MTITLTPETKTIVEAKLESGNFATAQDVVFAALQAMELHEIDDFEPGELKQVVAEGLANVETEGTLDADEAFAERRARRARERGRR
jgi:Arc/MetJ-type ribon-helix-helix transcriptional regulator